METLTAELIKLAATLIVGGGLVALYHARARRREIDAGTKRLDREADKLLSDAHRTDAEATTDLMAEIRATAKDVREMIRINADCMREKADEEVKRIKAEAEVVRVTAIAEVYRQENVAKERLIAELNGKIRRLERA